MIYFVISMNRSSERRNAPKEFVKHNYCKNLSKTYKAGTLGKTILKIFRQKDSAQDAID